MRAWSCFLPSRTDMLNVVPLVMEEFEMTESQITLTAEERTFLVGLLETAQKETRVEEHRTRAPSYREHVLQQGDLIAALLGKLQDTKKK
jgi:hypothetical protein